MGNKTATIRFNYYLVDLSQNDEQENGFKGDTEKKLENVLVYLESLPISKRRWPNGKNLDKSILLESAQKDKNGFWKLNFVKVRDEALPGKICANGEFTDIPLENDEYIGENTTVLYAPEKHLIGMQRNFYGANAGQIEEYFSHISDAFEMGVIFRFTPIINSHTIPETAIIRSIEVSCVDVKNQGLADVLTNVDTFGARRMNFKFTMGHYERKSGLANSALEYIKKRLKDPRCTKLEVAYKEEADMPLSSIDLLNNRLEDKISVLYSKENPINHEKIYLNILADFKKRANAL